MTTTTAAATHSSNNDWIYQEADEMAAILGIPAPTVWLFGEDKDARREMQRIEKQYKKDNICKNGLFGVAFREYNEIIIKQTRSPMRAVRIGGTRRTIAHELIHLKYKEKLEHGAEFDRHTTELVEQWKKWKKDNKR
jgi:hypothetical protein